MQNPPSSALLEGLAQHHVSNERKNCVSGSRLQEDGLGGHRISPAGLLVIWIHQFRTWPCVYMGGGWQMKGCLTTELPRAHTCLHSLQSSKSVGWSYLQGNNWSEVLTSDQGRCWHSMWWLPGNDDGQGFRNMLCPLGRALLEGKGFLEDPHFLNVPQATSSPVWCLRTYPSPPHSEKSLTFNSERWA